MYKLVIGRRYRILYGGTWTDAIFIWHEYSSEVGQMTLGFFIKKGYTTVILDGNELVAIPCQRKPYWWDQFDQFALELGRIC